MPAQAAIVLLALVLEHDDLLVPGLGEDLRPDAGARDIGSPEFRPAVAAHHQDLVQNDLVPRGPVQAFDAESVPHLNTILFAAGLQNCIHDHFPPSAGSRLPRRVPKDRPGDCAPAMRRIELNNSTHRQSIRQHKSPARLRVGYGTGSRGGNSGRDVAKRFQLGRAREGSAIGRRRPRVIRPGRSRARAKACLP